MEIRNINELRNAYSEISLYNSIVENRFTSISAKLQERIKKVKKAIRKYNRKEPKPVIIKDNGIDGWIEKIVLPENIRTRKEADEYFLTNEYMECSPSQYDCTGQLFTSWYKIFERQGRYIAYHYISRDV